MPIHSDYQRTSKQRNHNIHETLSSSRFSDETITLPHHLVNDSLLFH
ncbi:hypothetical protein SAMN05421784_11519 [Xenorhabdus koppenhoeferi]|uniref:Uncharacterized protein n=1 Tax=Xenorhabdus koppenhoeferi TaxID=351659 RepID=A0A1I7HKX2_9GAMM|nr:hypothetical protein SAMN05421784_11519 [Xenorhabdus koppenhoeferi]